MSLTKKLLAGEAVDGDENILALQARTFEIKSAVKLVGDFDGEAGDPLPLKIETVPRAINFFA